MTLSYNKIATHINLHALQQNWKVLDSRGGNAIAVVKSDAYGHGIRRTVQALIQVGATAFAVGTVEEGIALRRAGIVQAEHQVFSLLGPIENWEYELLGEYNIVPFVGNFEQLAKMNETSQRKKIQLRLSLKIDTGMARLGFSEQDIPALLTMLKKYSGLIPIMLSSHLATADDPEKYEFVRHQTASFIAIKKQLAEAGLRLQANLANSAALLAYPETHFDAQRAGIALYGTNPFYGTTWEEKGCGLLPSMAVSAPVLEVRTLKKGESVSYGQTYTATNDTDIAIIGAGYADGWSRCLSNIGAVCLHGMRAPILGRVCMQLTAVDISQCTRQVQVNDRAWLLGGEGEGRIHAHELAKWWQSISYEVFLSSWNE